MPHETAERDVVLHDYCVDSDTFLADVLAGLGRRPMRIPSKYFYDAEGSRLFDQITGLDAYYPTRTELAIMETHMPEIGARLGPGTLVIEYGSGSSQKTRLLLDHLERPAGYVPIDISREHLLEAARALANAYPELEVLPVCADYTQSFPVPEPDVKPRRSVVYFPGSTIGNLTPDLAVRFLKHARSVGDTMLLGADLIKDRDILERAYNDPDGVTAAFNQNVLRRINRELGADIDVDGFEHHAFFNDAEARVEMHLVALRDQILEIGGRSFSVGRGESICTEYSYKYSVESIASLATSAGYTLRTHWTDQDGWFGLFLLEVATTFTETAPEDAVDHVPLDQQPGKSRD
jgi:dimethylhistidine N-methyltransferase